MIMIHGSMKHTPNGRKRKTKAWTKRKTSPQRSFKPLIPTTNVMYEQSLAHREKYPSADSGKYVPPVDQSYKSEISSKYTVAPAYNKGAYQVIGKDNIKDIGR